MITLHVCPSTLREGFDTYSPQALKTLFRGKAVSHLFAEPSPTSDSGVVDEAVRHIGRISLSGAQTKFSVVVDADRLRYKV